MTTISLQNADCAPLEQLCQCWKGLQPKYFTQFPLPIRVHNLRQMQKRHQQNLPLIHSPSTLFHSPHRRTIVGGCSMSHHCGWSHSGLTSEKHMVLCNFRRLFAMITKCTHSSSGEGVKIWPWVTLPGVHLKTANFYVLASYPAPRFPACIIPVV